MSFTLFNALQILEVTIWSPLSSPILWKQKGHSVHVDCGLCYDSTIDALCFIRNALPKQWTL